MPRISLIWLALISLMLLEGCRKETAQQSADDFGLREISLPGGPVVKGETKSDTRDLWRGMMFRTSIAPDHGMLFVHEKPGYYSYWMYQVKIPLDTIWLD